MVHHTIDVYCSIPILFVIINAFFQFFVMEKSGVI